MILTTLGSSDMAFAIVALALAGALAGLLSGLFGIGGGSVIVPVLYTAFGWIGVDDTIRMQLTLGTSFAVIAPTGLRSYRAHRARGAVDQAALSRLLGPVLLGVIVGVMVASVASSLALRWVWVVAASVMSIKLAFGRDDWRLASTLPQSQAVEVAGFAIGLLSALMSIGGGLFMVTLLTLFGFPLLRAVATSAGFGPVIAVTGMLGYAVAGWGDQNLPPMSLGYVNWFAALLVVPTSLLLAPWGVRLAHGLPRRQLELAFAGFLAVVALRFLATIIL